MKTNTYPGKPYPLGATADAEGVNFALYSDNATAVDLCLFNSVDDTTEAERIPLAVKTHQVWHAYVPGLKTGQLYGFRVSGPYEPQNGLRFNNNKLLMDPYAKSIAGRIEWNDALFAYEVGSPDADLSFSEVDSAPFIPKSVVIEPEFDWSNEVKVHIPYHEAIIYEAHVKGFTFQHPEIPEEIRGTYAAIAHPVTIKYLQDLGITTLELMPVQQFTNDRNLQEKGLNNYWGYNTIGFFAPDVKYSSTGVCGEQVTEFKQMVKALHAAGIEVILDVVYNHTAEGNEMGPSLSFKGIDNPCYYRLMEDDKRFYMDYTGTGNTLNANLPNVLRYIMDSLRYWVIEMHVDGFRFDLAATLARELHEVNHLGSFFEIIYQDPILSQVKLIAEPWDLGEGGYQVGNFPAEWAEWNGKFRDSMRDYWIGADRMLGEFVQRLTGSADLYQDYRRPTASINFITAHDGFTLNDLVSYNEKHNDANGEDNNDGESHNRSWNCGAEGPTDDQAVNDLRARQKRNLLATLFLSQGVPMLVSGDEIGKTQGGNNNAYCQDNEISWLDWANADNDLLAFTQKLIKVRKDHPVFRRSNWLKGVSVDDHLEDVAWFLPEGDEMCEDDWSQHFAKSLGVFLNGKGIDYTDAKGDALIDDNFYIIFNAHHESLEYAIPDKIKGDNWQLILDTFDDKKEAQKVDANATITVQARSVVLLQQLSK